MAGRSRHFNRLLMFGRFRVSWRFDQNGFARINLNPIPPLTKSGAALHIARRKRKIAEGATIRDIWTAQQTQLLASLPALRAAIPPNAAAVAQAENKLRAIADLLTQIEEFILATEVQVAEIDERQRDYEGAQGAADQDWHISQELLDFRKEIDLCDNQLAALALRFGSVEHNLYFRSLIGAAIIGLDGTSVGIDERKESSAPVAPLPPAPHLPASAPPAGGADPELTELAAKTAHFKPEDPLKYLGSVNLGLAKSRLDSLRNGLLMTLERPVKQEQMVRVGTAALLFALIPWLLLLFSGSSILVAQSSLVGLLPAVASAWPALVGIGIVVCVLGFIIRDSNRFTAQQRAAQGQPAVKTPTPTSAAVQPIRASFGQGWPLVIGALVLAAIAIKTARLLDSGSKDWPPISNYLLFWTAAMVGVWLATGRRLQRMTFADLLTPDGDQFHPWVRLIRAGLLSLVLGLILSWGVVIEIFGLRTPAMFSNPGFAFAFGMLFGLSELLLPDAAAAKAEGLFKAVNRNDTA